MSEFTVGDPLNSDDYRRVLGKVPTSAVVVAATADDGRPCGLTVGSFTSVSLDPPLVGFFVGRSSSTWPTIALTGGFCASVLSAPQESVCRTFAATGAERFASCQWHLSGHGRPIIDGAVAWIDCSIHETVPTGDHVLVLGSIDAMSASDETNPLVFLGGRCGQFTSAAV